MQLSVVAKVSKVFDENTSSMLDWALASGGTEQNAPHCGEHKLEEYFREIYNGYPSPQFPGVYDVVVHSGTVFEQFINVEHPGTISYKFQTTGKDITFVVCKTDSEGNILHPLVRLEKAQSHTEPIEGKIFAEEPGTYLLKWDNAYSKVTAKVLSYKIVVTASE